MQSRWAYLNDIKGCEVTAIYTLNALREIVYLKNGRLKSLTLCYNVAGGAMGYVESFYCDSIPLPPSKTLSALSSVIHRIDDYNLYGSDTGWERYEELELITDAGNFLLFFNREDDDAPYAVEPNRRSSLPLYDQQERQLSQELFSVEEFKENLAFALMAHGEQKTPHGLPYSMHLLSVATEVINALIMEPLSYDENNVAISCALLHDVNEDTLTKVHENNTQIAGNREVIAKGVAALTKDKTLSSKEAQMNDSIERLKKRQNCVVLVKLADRITNLGVPPSHWDRTKKSAYLEEARLILEHLGYAHHYLADKLFQKIKAYESYM